MALLSPDILASFLDAAAHRRKVYGEWDCLLFLAAWVQEARCVDPARLYRGRYACEIDARLFVRDAGGMVALVDQALRPFDIRRVKPSAIRRGDIAIVKAVEGEMGAILLGPTWRAMMGEAGLVWRTASTTPIVAAWAVRA